VSLLAVTGGTGFVGQHLIRVALEQGHRVRALARRPQPTQAGVDWIAGSLESHESLTKITMGADAVIHVAGAINAPDREGFAAANITGTEAMLTAARAGGVGRFVHVSSLAAREPGLSDYGWSKAQSERIVRASGLDWTIVRPPAVYGPGDREMLELFRLARWGVVPLPPAGGRMSLIAAQDLVRLLLALVPPGTGSETVIEPDDGAPNGWDHRDFVRAISSAVGRHVLPLPLPRALLDTASFIDRWLRRGNAKLTRDRVRYFCHPDWVVHAPPPASLWQPAIETRSGLAATARAYREAGWL
jgi:nucleoside-diphosphate-sugar epimerase